eukprot:gene10891-11868_t
MERKKEESIHFRNEERKKLITLIRSKSLRGKWRGGTYSEWILVEKRIKEIFAECGLLEHLEGKKNPPKATSLSEIETRFYNAVELVLGTYDRKLGELNSSFCTITGEIPPQLTARYIYETQKLNDWKIKCIRTLDEAYQQEVATFYSQKESLLNALTAFEQKQQKSLELFTILIGENCRSMIETELTRKKIHEAWEKLKRIERMMAGDLIAPQIKDHLNKFKYHPNEMSIEQFLDDINTLMNAIPSSEEQFSEGEKRKIVHAALVNLKASDKPIVIQLFNSRYINK